MTGTPPSIPIDSTIRAAPIIMDRIGMNPQACLFGEVELSLIWEKVRTLQNLCGRHFSHNRRSVLTGSLRNGGASVILPL